MKTYTYKECQYISGKVKTKTPRSRYKIDDLQSLKKKYFMRFYLKILLKDIQKHQRNNNCIPDGCAVVLRHHHFNE